MNAFGRRATDLALILVATAALAACASAPKPMGPVATSTPPPAARPESPPSAAREAEPVEETAETGVPTPGSVRDFVINAGDTVYFDLDSSTLRADARPVLEAQAAWLRRYSAVRVRIEGNCDERGTREYNFALGARRANAVREFLVGRGLSAGRIETISYGKERPIDPGSNEQAWARNRNSHTAITGGAR
jgi:peptidoglycan-associated lipoprotein